MISDEQMDARLAEAGNQWRAANTGAYARETTPPETFPVIEARPAPLRSRWTLLISAAAVVAILAGGGIWFANRPSYQHSSATGPGPFTNTHSGLTGVRWKLYSLDSGEGIDPGFSSTTGFGGYLEIGADGAVTGFDGCNTFSGSSTIDGTSISFGQISSTAIGCTDPNVGRVVAGMSEFMSGASTWRIDLTGMGKHLVLSKPNGHAISFNAAAPPSSNVNTMVGTWQLYETDHTSAAGDSGSASGSSEDGDEILAIAADGTFKVQHRCYANSGTAVIGTGTADFGKAHLDGSSPCPSLDPAAMKDEQTRDALIDRVLDGATSWTIRAGDLRITKGEDTLVYLAYGAGGGSGTTAGPSGTPS